MFIEDNDTIYDRLHWAKCMLEFLSDSICGNHESWGIPEDVSQGIYCNIEIIKEIIDDVISDPIADKRLPTRTMGGNKR